jgi:hypothetical protein
MLRAIFATTLSCILASACTEMAEAPAETADAAQVKTEIKTQAGAGDYEKLGQELLATEDINGMRVGAPFSMPAEALTDWVDTPALKWEADGLYHRSYIHRTSRDEISVACPDSACTGPLIHSISLSEASSLKTMRRIGIGSSAEEVRLAYKQYLNPEESNDSTLVAGTVYGGMIFTLRNGKVAQLFMGAAAE